MLSGCATEKRMSTYNLCFKPVADDYNIICAVPGGAQGFDMREIHCRRTGSTPGGIPEYMCLVAE